MIPSRGKPAAPSPLADRSTPILHRYDPSQPVTLPVSVTGKAKMDAPEVPVSAEKSAGQSTNKPTADRPAEIGGPSGPEPTRYGDWERNGRVSDF